MSIDENGARLDQVASDDFQMEIQDPSNVWVHFGQLAVTGQLSADVAHEMNNPLTGVVSIAMLLREEFELLPEQVRTKLPDFPKQLELLVQAAEKIREIAGNLATFAQEKHTQTRSIHLEEILSKTLCLIGVRFRHARVKLTVALEPGLPPVLGHSVRLQRALTNILMNCADFTESGGATEIVGALAGPEVRITIRDTGTGITAENLKRVARPFFTTKPPGEGLGLGLSSAIQLVKDQGGRIEIESEIGKGTRVLVYLPVEASARRPQ